MLVLTTGLVWENAGWGREEMRMRANGADLCHRSVECTESSGPRKQMPTFPEDILLKTRIVIQPNHFSFGHLSKRLPIAKMDF